MAWRARSPIAYAAFLGLAFFAFHDLTGTPKSFGVPEEANVLWHMSVEDEAIYILTEGPRLYRLPWDRDAAEQAQGARRKAGEGTIILEYREDPTFHAEPQKPEQPKGNNRSQAGE